MSAQLLSTSQGRTMVLTLSNPGHRNALGPEMYAAGVEALNTADADPSLRAVVLRGDGEHFCAGGDLNRLAGVRQRGPEEQARSIEGFHAWVQGIREFPKPVIAAVEGHAAGGGCSLALACDLIIAAEGARFTLSYGRAGLSPDGGSTWHLARTLPRATVLQMLWLPEPMTARQWHEFGLVNGLADDGQALSQALRWADRLAGMASNALASVKALVEQAPARDLSAQLAAERDQFIANLFHANGGEGLAAFFDKRRPKFS